MFQDGTWSGTEFRTVGDMRGLYTIEEIGKRTIPNYSGQGVCLYLENTGNSRCYIRSITVHGYLVSKKKHFRWERIS